MKKRYLLIALLLLLLSVACAVMKQGTVPTASVKGTVGDVCEVAVDCVDQGYLQGLPMACDADNPNSMLSKFNTDTTVDGFEMGGQAVPLCAAIDTCLAEWDTLPPYKKRDYARWCDWLEKIAAAATVN